MSAIEERLGKNIAKLRKAADCTQAQLAERVGVQPEHISRIETGRRGVSIETLSNIAKGLGVELHEVFRPQDKGEPKGDALNRLMRFGSQLTAAEIDLVMAAGSAVLEHTRPQRGPPTCRVE
jgi:transcriptional regulator with XRE-family HTH domain